MIKNFIKPEIAISMFNKENIVTESNTAVALQTEMATFGGETTVTNISATGGTDFSVFGEQN